MSKYQRNKPCICGSGKALKNCHLDIFKLASYNQSKSEHDVRVKINEVAKQMRKDLKLMSDTYQATSVKNHKTSIVIYSVNGIPAVEVNYAGLPLTMDTIKNQEEIAKADLSKIVIISLYEPAKEKDMCLKGLKSETKPI